MEKATESIRAMLVELIAEDRNSPKITALLLCLNQLMSPEEFINHIELLAQGADIKAFHLLERWAKEYPDDVFQVRDKALALVRSQSKNAQLVLSDLDSLLVSLTASSSSLPPSSGDGNGDVDITTFSVKDMAEEWTRWAAGRCKSVTAREILDGGNIPDHRQQMRLSDQCVRWIIMELLSRKKLEGRKKVLDRFIRIGYTCLKWNDFNSAFEIMTAFDSPQIARLHDLFQDMNRTTFTQFNELADFFNSRDSYGTYRKKVAELEATGERYIPNFGLVCQDVNNLREAMKIVKGNFNAVYKLAVRCTTILDYFLVEPSPAAKYDDLKSHSDVAQMFIARRDHCLLNSTDLFDMSRLILPVKNAKVMYQQMLDSEDIKAVYSDIWESPKQINGRSSSKDRKRKSPEARVLDRLFPTLLAKENFKLLDTYLLAVHELAGFDAFMRRIRATLRDVSIGFEDQVRSLEVLRIWLENFPVDFQRTEVRADLLVLLNNYTPNLPGTHPIFDRKASLIESIESVVDDDESETRLSSTNAFTKELSIPSKIAKAKNRTRRTSSTSEESIADILTVLDLEWSKELQRRDFMREGNLKGSVIIEDESDYNIRWVATRILAGNSKEDLKESAIQFIRIAHRCLSNFNFKEVSNSFIRVDD